MSRGIFITGTNTGVGKTVVTRALVRAAKRRGIDAAALKPIESGVVPGARTDAADLAAAADRGDDSESLCVYAFREAISPHLAAQAEGRVIEPEPVLRFLESWRGRTDLTISEGAGGLLVPLAPGLTFADLIAQSGFSLLVTAPDVLGTINATMLTLEAARHRGIPIVGTVLNGTPQADWGNGPAIEAYSGTRVLGSLPSLETNDDDKLADAAEAGLDLDAIFSVQP